MARPAGWTWGGTLYCSLFRWLSNNVSLNRRTAGWTSQHSSFKVAKLFKFFNMCSIRRAKKKARECFYTIRQHRVPSCFVIIPMLVVGSPFTGITSPVHGNYPIAGQVAAIMLARAWVEDNTALGYKVLQGKSVVGPFAPPVLTSANTCPAQPPGANPNGCVKPILLPARWVNSARTFFGEE